MGHFLKDQFVKNITIKEDTIKQLSALFSSRLTSLNEEITDDDINKVVFLTYIIRFDNKGYRVFSLEDLLLHFHQAKEIERVVITLENIESLHSGRRAGLCMELIFDKKAGNTLMVTADDRDWVEANFSAVEDILDKYKNMYGWARTAWTQLGVQVAGVMFGFFMSLWLAVKISPKLSIQNSFIIFFLFVLLIFSNTWTYLNKLILDFINYYFPNLKFYRPDKDRFAWLMQAIIGGIIVAILLSVLGHIYSYCEKFLISFIS